MVNYESNMHHEIAKNYITMRIIHQWLLSQILLRLGQFKT